MGERKLLPDLLNIPHLVLETQSGERAEFLFRGTKGYIQQCELGLCMALAFPRRVEGPNWAHRISLLLASHERTFDFGLQYNGQHWLLWRRHDSPHVFTADACKHALDNMLSVMRFLYSCSAKSGAMPLSSMHKASIARFV
jgi:hypothetical protein